jgi:hypothetical protein
MDPEPEARPVSLGVARADADIEGTKDAKVMSDVVSFRKGQELPIIYGMNEMMATMTQAEK